MTTSAPTTVGQVILHPPLGAYVTERLPNNPYSGHNVLTRPRGVQNTDARGLLWAADPLPPGFGQSPSWSTTVLADRDIAAIQIVHRLFDGTSVVDQVVLSAQTSSFVVFSELLPFSVIADFAPGVRMTLFWLLFLE